MVAATYATDSVGLHAEVMRLHTENTHLREIVDTQLAVITDLKAERDAHKALRDNPNLTPLRKDTLEVVYELMGCPLGTSPATRSYPDTIVSHTKIAERLGVSAKQVGKHLTDMETDGWLKRWQATGVNSENGKPTTHYHYEPVEGEAFLHTVGTPGNLMERHDPVTSTLGVDAEKAKDRRKLIEARCPVCKTTDCTIHCSNGHSTHMNAVDDARPPRPVVTKRRAHHAREHGNSGADSTIPTAESPVAEESSATQNVGAVAEDSSAIYVPSDGTYSAEETPDARDASDAQPVAEESSLALGAAVAALVPVVTRHPDGVRMRGGKPKYLSIGRPLAAGDIEAHMRGEQTYGAGLLYETPEGPRTMALVWDEDGRFDRFPRSAARLDQAGLRPVLVQNPMNPQRGHLLLLFNAPCDPAWAIAAAERLAPELRAVEERFPDLKEKGGARVRLPGGSYVLPDGRRRPVLVAAGTVDGPGTWFDGTTPEAWALIGAALSDPAILAATFVPRDDRPKRAAARTLWRPKPGITIRGSHGGDDIFARFNAEHSIEDMVDVGRDHKFVAPWREEKTASVHVYDDGHWHDHGPDKRHGRDAFDLWCALNGYWNEGANRPDRKAAYAALKGENDTTPVPSAPPAPPAPRPPSAPSVALEPPQSPSLSSLAPPCRYESHRGHEWARPDGRGLVCGICHPQPPPRALHIPDSAAIRQEAPHGH